MYHHHAEKKTSHGSVFCFIYVNCTFSILCLVFSHNGCLFLLLIKSEKSIVEEFTECESY